ncbi:hypothetical protein FGG08_000439 [Glutinoglossum americanum]|uniref:Aminoglycoside phosphotransferase domain-containing protein n=1 Tax=Glutinoglossum americanum TaxID=1670608 RepID=A0A9P8II41_9PEZI|nr:hypothetical protein FGG08_000439 [Glutinoglossum americanum]
MQSVHPTPSSDIYDVVTLPSTNPTSSGHGTSSLEAFAPLISNLQTEAISSLAIRVRSQMNDQPSPPPSCVVMGPPICGSFNLIYCLEFSDNIKWILRIPINGTRSAFTNAALALRSAILTSKYIKKHTTIPVPDIYEFKTNIDDSEIGAPYTLMSFAEGMPLWRRWYDTSLEPTLLQERRIQILEGVAKAMSQLQGLEFPKIGALKFDDPTSLIVTDITEYQTPDERADLSSLEGDDEMPHFCQMGPFSTTQDFFGALMARKHPDWQGDNFSNGMSELLRMMIGCLPLSTPAMKGTLTETFVLTHPDYNYQNFLVADDGALTCVLDWDCISTVPRCIGYSRYPGWITRDWHPMYDYDRATPMENSPEELEEFRREWDRIMGGLLGKDYVPKTHLFEAISLAVEQPMMWSCVMDKMCKKCFQRPLFEVDLGSEVDAEWATPEGGSGSLQEARGSDGGLGSPNRGGIFDHASELGRHSETDYEIDIRSDGGVSGPIPRNTDSEGDPFGGDEQGSTVWSEDSPEDSDYRSWFRGTAVALGSGTLEPEKVAILRETIEGFFRL